MVVVQKGHIADTGGVQLPPIIVLFSMSCIDSVWPSSSLWIIESERSPEDSRWSCGGKRERGRERERNRERESAKMKEKKNTHFFLN